MEAGGINAYDELRAQLRINPMDTMTGAKRWAIFVIGFLLSGILADYKEAERIRAEIRTAMEAINGNLFVKMGTAWWLLSR